MTYENYDGMPPHNGTLTSYLAALQARHNITEDMALVYTQLQRVGEFGATDDEMEEALGRVHQTVSARRRDLVLYGLVKNSGRTRLTRNNRHAIVWVLGLDLNLEKHSAKRVVLPSKSELRRALASLRQIVNAAASAGHVTQDIGDLNKMAIWLRALADS
jgi:hypothetical protein